SMLLIAGLFFGLGADLTRATAGEEFTAISTALALALTVAILLYDGWLKRIWLGPVAMGACRFINVLLGISISGTLGGAVGWHLALVVGLYIVGVTWLARTEAGTTTSASVAAAAVVLLMALALAIPLPLHDGVAHSVLFPYLLVAVGFAIGIPVMQAL